MDEIEKYFEKSRPYSENTSAEKIEELKEYFYREMTSLKDLDEENLYKIPRLYGNLENRTFNLFDDFEKEVEDLIEKVAMTRLENVYVGLVIRKHCMENISPEKLTAMKKREELKQLSKK